MSRMYYSFDVNLPNSDNKQWKGEMTLPSVDYIAFETQDEIISIDAFENGFHIENGIYIGDMKNLWVCIEGGKYDTHGEYVQKMKDEYFELLKNAKPYEIGLFISDYKFTKPIKSRNLNVKIIYGDEEMIKNANPISILYYGDEVETIEVDNSKL